LDYRIDDHLLDYRIYRNPTSPSNTTMLPYKS
jgi:hypothetical protein